jgi:hypothetical protein
MSDQWIRASEISNYVYCRRAWWMQRKQGHASANVQEMRYGVQHHQQHGRLLVQAVWGRRLALFFLFTLIAFATYQILAK